MIRRRLALALLLIASATPALAQGMLERFQSGVHYIPIQPAQPTPADRIEVIEVFSYACVHCNEFQGRVDTWYTNKPEDAVLRYLPAVFSQQFAAYAAAYFAAEELGIAKAAHQPMYDKLWKEQKRFGSMQEIAEFYAGYGTTAEAFMAAVSAPAMQERLQKANAEAQAFGIEGTPTVIVAGKYRVSGASAGGYDKVFEVVNFLIEKERAHRAALKG
jgi:thiol:disulfide interchange protein DsbA